MVIVSAGSEKSFVISGEIRAGLKRNAPFAGAVMVTRVVFVIPFFALVVLLILPIFRNCSFSASVRLGAGVEDAASFLSGAGSARGTKKNAVRATRNNALRFIFRTPDV